MPWDTQVAGRYLTNLIYNMLIMHIHKILLCLLYDCFVVFSRLVINTVPPPPRSLARPLSTPVQPHSAYHCFLPSLSPAPLPTATAAGFSGARVSMNSPLVEEYDPMCPQLQRIPCPVARLLLLLESIFEKFCAIHKRPKKQDTQALTRWTLILRDYTYIRQLLYPASGSYLV